MGILPAVGTISLGIVVGWLVRYAVRRFKSHTPKALAAVVSVLVGGAALNFVQRDSTTWWFYPVGLLLGFVLYSIVALAAGAEREGTLYGPPDERFENHREAPREDQ